MAGTAIDVPTLYLIDGSGFIFRAYHALPPLTRADGTPVGAVLGFCNILLRVLQDLCADHLAVIFDAGRATFRQDLYPAYKAHRPDPPADLVPQFALVRAATQAFGVPAIDLPGYEADDIIATYARQAAAAGWQVEIISSDKDLMQLVDQRIRLRDPLRLSPLDETAVIAKFGVPPAQVPAVQALAGDSVDNIPGVPGIGIKTAAELIGQYGDLETLLARAGEIPQPKRRASLLEHAAAARLSLQLVTLVDTTPVPVPFTALVPRLETEARRAFLEQQGFRQLLARLGETGTPPAPQTASPPMPPATAAVAASYTLVQEIEVLHTWVAQARIAGRVAIDTETSSLVPSVARLIGFSLAVAPGQACYVPLAHRDPDSVADELSLAAPAPRQIPIAAACEAIRALLVDPTVLKVGHNLKYDLQVLAQHGLAVTPYDDTLLLSFLLDAGRHGHGLEELAARHFGITLQSYAEVTTRQREKVSFDRVPLAAACAYAAADADFSLRLWHVLRPQLPTAGLSSLYERIERPLVPIIAAMEQAGISIDPAILRTLGADFAARARVLEEELYRLAGHTFNPASPKQLGGILFDELGLPPTPKSKTGQYATGSEYLEPLAEQGYRIAAALLEWRALSKLQSTYTEALQQAIQPATGRVHTSFSMVGAATGRLSSTDPNLQNIPIRTDDGRAIRRAFVAAPGMVLVSVDYSQIELRLVADMAAVPAMRQAFHEGRDIHQQTASEVLGIPLSTVTAEQRRSAKAINFGIIYGISAFGLGRQLGISSGEASAFISAYFERYPEIRTYMEAMKELARRQGFVTTRFGRRCHIRDIAAKQPAARAFAERQAINAPLQGTAADIIKLGMIASSAALRDQGGTARLLLQVHDELLIEAPANEAAFIAALIKEKMEGVARLSVPLVAETGIGPHWGAAH